MPEILTESFCERCGTRYTFESAAPRTTRLKGVKVLSRGLKNFVMSDDTSLDEAMAAARNDTDREVTSQQLDAFHKTFNFCMQCRQYTCANCWNEAEGRCLTCAPHLGQGILEAPFPNLDAATGQDFRLETNGNGSNGTNGHHHEPALPPLAWPTSDLLQADAVDEPLPETPAWSESADSDPLEPIDAIARLAALDAAVEPPKDAAADAADADAEPRAEAIDEDVAAGATQADDVADTPAVTAAPAVDAPAVDAHAIDAAPEAAAAPIETDGIDARAAAATAATARLLRSFRPGQSLDAALEAYEREQAAGPTEAPASEPLAAEDVEPVAAAEPEPVVAEVAPEPIVPEPIVPEPIAAEPESLVAETTHPVDRVEQPTWRIVAPDTTPSPTDGGPAPEAPAAPPIAASAEPQWPAQPQWPTHTPNAGLPFLGRPATPTGGIEALWAESAREVSAVPTTGPVALAPVGSAKVAGGVQPCVSCGLSLSATARFCRRCGSRQG